MKNRLWLGFTSLITFICLELLTLFGYSVLTELTFRETIYDFRYLFVMFLLLLVFLIWMYDIFIGSRRTIRNKKKRKWIYMRVNWIMTIVSFLLLPITGLSSMGYVSYVNYPGLKPFEKAITKSYETGLELAIDNMSRHGTWKGEVIVAHAMGGIDGKTYTLSKEAFEQNYKKGFRYFELDFISTKEGDIVLRHFWDKKKNGDYNVLSLEKFKKSKSVGGYTPVTLKDFLTWMKEKPDLWVVTDSKEDAVETFTEIVKEAKEIGAEEVLDRFIIQFFDTDMYFALKEVYPFKNYIFATYKTWDGNLAGFGSYCQFCIDNHVDSISMWNYHCTQEVIDIANYYGIDVYVHSENDLEAAKQFLEMGVRGIYTDFIEPKELR